MNDQELQDLIRLKRYEQPEEGYYESFLEEFHERRQQELLTSSARSLLMERVSVWFSQLGAIKWVAGAGLAYAAVAVTVIMIQTDSPVDAPLATALPQQPTVSNKTVDAAQEEAVMPVTMAHSRPLTLSRGRQPLAGGTEQLF